MGVNNFVILLIHVKFYPQHVQKYLYAKKKIGPYILSGPDIK